MIKKLFVILAVASLILILFTACSKQQQAPPATAPETNPAGTAQPESSAQETQQQEQEKTTMPNPASVNCIDKGGELEIRKTPEGEVGYCLFSNGKECEEWQLFRGECNVEAQQAITAQNTPKQKETSPKTTEISQQDLDNLKKSIDSINTEDITGLSA